MLRDAEHEAVMILPSSLLETLAEDEKILCKGYTVGTADSYSISQDIAKYEKLKSLFVICMYGRIS